MGSLPFAVNTPGYIIQYTGVKRKPMGMHAMRMLLDRVKTCPAAATVPSGQYDLDRTLERALNAQT